MRSFDIYRVGVGEENNWMGFEVTSTEFQPTFKLYRYLSYRPHTLVAESDDSNGRAHLVRTNLLGYYYLVVKAGTAGGLGNYQLRFSVDAWVHVYPDPRFDYFGSEGTDLSVYRPSNNTWYILQDSGGIKTVHFGEPGDKLVPADYDGDGKTDIAMYRPSAGTWFIVESQSQTMRTVIWGEPDDIPIPMGYGYGTGSAARIALFRPSNGTWYIRTRNDVFSSFQWGQPGDKPVYGGFGYQYDAAVFRPSEGKWYFRTHFLGNQVVHWGEAGDIPVPADYDNDGYTDLGLYRPSTGEWYLFLTRYRNFYVVQWGEPGDIPVTDDYLYDGRNDLAVYRPSNNRWYFVSFDTQYIRSWSVKFGEPGDIPTPGAYNN